MLDIRSALESGLAGFYEIERELGRGGMARVFLVHDRKHDRRVALKVLNPELAATIGPERFLREIRVAARLQHPHILTVHDSGEIPASGGEPALLWYTMPFVEEETLRQRLTREGPLPLADAVRIAGEAADALGYAHEHGVIHRDIKPENLLLSAGHTMVADFGIALALGDGAQHLTATGMSIGTPAYMSPEQAAGQPADARSDVWALGCVLYEMLAGEPPYTGRSPLHVAARVMSEPYRPLRAMRDTVPPALEQAVATALARTPADRFATAAEMSRALSPSIITPGSAPTEPVRQAAQARPRRRRIAMLSVAGALVLAAFALVFQLPRDSQAAALDPSLVAVAPFDLVSPDQELAVWSEGLVDVLARYFDGAGTMHAVAPTRAIRAWNGRADRESAVRFGRAVSARYVVFGQLVGSDSVRLTATLYDLAGPTVLDEGEWRGTSQRLDRLADSLATRFLDVLGRTRELGQVRTDPLGTSNPTAIREFLNGMRDLRRAAYDDAARHFVESIAQDTGFVLGRLYASQAIGWQRDAGAPAKLRYALEGGVRNHGLNPRDSLLLLVDSLEAAIMQTRAPPFQLMERMWRVLDRLLALRPDDPEVLYAVADQNHHLNALGKSERWHLERFRHAVRLDPLFAPAYEHAVQLSAMLDPPEDARALIRGMLAVPGIDTVRAEGLRLADRLLDTAQSYRARQEALDSTRDVRVLQRAWFYVGRVPDSIGLIARRAILARAPGTAPEDALIRTLLYHGRLREAAALLPKASFPALFARELASLGVIPISVFDSLTAEAWDAPGGIGPAMGVPLWLEARDTVRLKRLVQRAEGAMAARPDARVQLGIAVQAFRGFLDLARGDSSWFRTDRNPGAPGMAAETPFGNLVAELALALRPEDEAWALLQSQSHSGTPTGVLWMLHRARLAEKRGERGIALDDYGFVARLWANADEPLRSHAREAREGLIRLTRERW